MNKILRFIVLAILLFGVTGCTPTRDLNQDTKVPSNSENSLPEFTLAELATYDGKDGNKAYIAVEGVIYDVTNEWEDGEHNGYNAGTDVTNFINNAPHKDSVLSNLEKVGVLVTE